MPFWTPSRVDTFHAQHQFVEFSVFGDTINCWFIKNTIRQVKIAFIPGIYMGKLIVFLMNRHLFVSPIAENSKKWCCTDFWGWRLEDFLNA